MMDKDVHDRNAFHYSCWRSETKVATTGDMIPIEGVSRVGTENGEGHPAAYYETDVRIPSVVPNGVYILGWSWFGGTQGGVLENRNPPTVKPGRDGFFRDYWTCSKVRITGGPRVESYTPVFVNDMPQFSDGGCMSANNELGVCVNEPCSASARFRKPREFLRGDPSPVTPVMFREGLVDDAEPDDEPIGDSEDTEDTSNLSTPRPQKDSKELVDVWKWALDVGKELRAGRMEHVSQGLLQRFRAHNANVHVVHSVGGGGPHYA